MNIRELIKYFFISMSVVILTACGSNDTPTDKTLKSLISTYDLSGNALKNKKIPNILEDKPQLGMRLFFSKSFLII